MKLVAGIFIGGRGSRMGGKAKGLLRGPDGERTLIERSTDLVRQACPTAETLLVGEHEAYAHLSLEVLPDAASGNGPLAGLVALLRRARAAQAQALAIACDLPYLTAPTLTRLCTVAPDADAVAPRPDGVWQPLLARYRPAACLSIAEAQLRAGQLAVWRVLEALGERAVAVELDASEVQDWDTPEDMA